jgi:carboxypeptidase Taq
MQTLEQPHPKLQALNTYLAEISDLESAASLLYWDQATHMPAGGAAARGRQLATLHHIAHTKLIAPQIGQLLDDLQSYEASLPYHSNEASLIRVTRRRYQQAVKVPAEFAAKLARHQASAYEAWAKARPNNDFAAVQPYLETMLELSRDYAAFFPGYEHIADPLIEAADYGMKATTVKTLFAALREQLVPIVDAIAAQPVADDACLRQSFPEAQQLEFSLSVIRQLGYDFQRGRQDKTLHPFMTKFSTGDVRITTRVREDDLSEGLFSTIHEMGHALYEQGIDPSYEATPLAEGTSAGVHESQSRLWENLVGRSRDFWTYFYPQLQRQFSAQLGAVPLETFYRALNKVERSLIRTDADEITYNLHVMIRFDLELELLEGTLAVRDLPAAWNDRYHSDLGVVPPSDSNGVLQDVHWYSGMVGGMFQGYTLGNLMSAQFFEAALKTNPDIPTQIANGQFDPLRSWLIENLYQHGSKFTAHELVEQVTGQPLSITPFIRYIRQKYGELYTGLP